MDRVSMSGNVQGSVDKNSGAPPWRDTGQQMEFPCPELCRDVTYMPPRDRQTAKRKEKACTEEWIKSEDGITEKITGPNGVYTRFVSTSPPESEQDDA